MMSRSGSGSSGRGRVFYEECDAGDAEDDGEDGKLEVDQGHSVHSGARVLAGCPGRSFLFLCGRCPFLNGCLVWYQQQYALGCYISMSGLFPWVQPLYYGRGLCPVKSLVMIFGLAFSGVCVLVR
ncbi:hypothetical protein SUGI_1180600 [Cryptomeria japonica]|nr:hypothetical protein SUGI_1180600 [Cryptomeria japonica]